MDADLLESNKSITIWDTRPFNERGTDGPTINWEDSDFSLNN